MDSLLNRSRWSGHAALLAPLVLVAACGGSSSTVPSGDPDSIELSAPVVAFSSLLATEDLDATVRDVGGAVIAATVAWSTDDPSVVTVTNQGVVMAVGNGTAHVIAAAGAVEDTAEITVQQVAATLSLAPDTLRFASAGDTATISRTVRDAGGSPMSGVAVTFATVNPSVATVNVSSGRVTAQGNGATNITAQVAPGGSGLTKSVRVEVGGALAPAYLVGGYLGTAYTDQVGPASGGGTFTYAVTAGALPGGLALSSSTADITGTPNASGVFFFEVTATNGTLTLSERYAITISTKPSSAFNLWIAYNGGPMPSANVRTAITNALDRWEEVVNTDAGAAVTYPPNAFSSGQCQLVTGTLFNNAFIEDVAVLLAVGPIDGLNNTLAQGGPCGSTRPQIPVVISGQMKLDEADAGASATFLQDVLWHEIAHVLGIGTLWQGSTTGVGTPTVFYNGTNGNAEWRAYGGPADGVPLEPDIGAHWHEGYFDDEIMTPRAEGPSAVHPISRITIGALLDLGWGALLSSADPYSLPGCSPACTVPARAAGEGGDARLDDVVIEPLTPLPPQAFRD
ncbi:MAG: putative Ig domain-containing protein [Gemmatimonadales bacterium]